MAKAKSNKSKASTIKQDVPKKEVEVKVEAAPKKEAQSYLVPLAFKREPIEKDIPVADIFYHKFSNSFELQCHAPQHEAHVE